MIAVTSSSARMSVAMKPVQNAWSGIERVPCAPVTSTVASSARRAVPTSPPGDGVNRLPPTVAMLRIAQLPVLRAAVASSGACAWSARVVSVVIAPMRRVSPVRSMPSMPARRRPITRRGSEVPSLIPCIAIVPPAITSRSGPCSPSSASASGTEVGWK